MADFSIPLAGMSNAVSRLNTAASRIARAPFPHQNNTPPDAQDSVSLSDDVVAMLESRTDFEANTKVVKTFDEMTKSLLNIVG